MFYVLKCVLSLLASFLKCFLSFKLNFLYASGFPAKKPLSLGSVHYLYPGLVPKRNGLDKPFFWSVKGWVISFLEKA